MAPACGVEPQPLASKASVQTARQTPDQRSGTGARIRTGRTPGLNRLAMPFAYARKLVEAAGIEPAWPKRLFYRQPRLHSGLDLLNIGGPPRIRTETDVLLRHVRLPIAPAAQHVLAEETGIEPATLTGDGFRDRSGPCPSPPQTYAVRSESPD